MVSLLSRPEPRISRYDALMAYNLKKGLVGAWPLDEASGTRRDHSGRGNDLTDNNTVTGTDGPSIYIPKASQLTRANNEFLNVGSNAELRGSGSFTFGGFFKADSYATPAPIGNALMGKWNSGGAYEYLLKMEVFADPANNRITFYLSSTGANATGLEADSFGQPPTGTWYGVRAWYDDVLKTQNVQVNLGAIDSQAYAAGVFQGNGAFVIGQHDGDATTVWDGAIAQTFLIKRVLTPQEWAWLYNRGDGRSTSQLRIAA